MQRWAIRHCCQGIVYKEKQAYKSEIGHIFCKVYQKTRYSIFSIMYIRVQKNSLMKKAPGRRLFRYGILQKALL